MNTETHTSIITALIKPQTEGSVVRALHDLPEFPGFTLCEVRDKGAAGAREARTAQLNTISPITDTCNCKLSVEPMRRWKSATRSPGRRGPGTKATA